MRTLFLLAAMALAQSVSATSLQPPVLSTDVDEKSCQARKPGSTFQSIERQIFFSTVARGIAAGDRLRIEWIAPGGSVSDSVEYPPLPASPALCFITQLPVSGFPAGSQPGAWAVRVVVNDQEAVRVPFVVEVAAGAGRLRVDAVRRSVVGKETELVLEGAGFDSNSMVHIAEYRKEGGWRYVHSVLPVSAAGSRLVVRIPDLPTGEYVAIVKNADDTLSAPARVVVASSHGYQLPIVNGEKWMITQGPYGGFSHWGNTLHAYDIAPTNGQWVAAMRAGVAHVHDVGAVQSHVLRTFGNYITVDHGDGEFSHYGHLLTGSFQVREGERVEAGQVLAHVGNSGYTFGGYHVHVQVSRALPVYSPSVPFRFSEFAEVPAQALRNVEVSSNRPAVAPKAQTVTPATKPSNVVAKRWLGKVAVAGMWTELVSVPAGARGMELELACAQSDRDVALRIISPSGREYGAFGDPTGYSGSRAKPKTFRIANPEPGMWRVVAAGMVGGGDAIEFTLDASVTPPVPVVKPTVPARRVVATRGPRIA